MFLNHPSSQRSKLMALNTTWLLLMSLSKSSSTARCWLFKEPHTDCDLGEIICLTSIPRCACQELSVAIKARSITINVLCSFTWVNKMTQNHDCRWSSCVSSAVVLADTLLLFSAADREMFEEQNDQRWYCFWPVDIAPGVTTRVSDAVGGGVIVSEREARWELSAWTKCNSIKEVMWT